MQNNSGDLSMQNIMRMISSPAGQQLLALLKQSDPQALQKAMEQATSGDYSNAKKSLSPFFESEEVKKLLQQLGG